MRIWKMTILPNTTAEHPLVSKWWNATFIQIWWRNKLIYILDDLRARTCSVYFHFWVNFSYKRNPYWCILHLIMSNKPKREIMFEIHEQGNVPHNSLQFHRKYLLNACAVTLRSCIAERLCGWTAVAFPASLRTAAAEATGCLRNSILSRAGARTPPTLRAFRGNHSYPSPSGERSYHPPGDAALQHRTIGLGSIWGMLEGACILPFPFLWKTASPAGHIPIAISLSLSAVLH